ncbi:hypothetical protein EDF81_0714 [Enterobacter sp. BIGb0383]|uniref:hypothetical protein n=1 Tax=unclassified Enterobacter TaxID=2608935 RepID=UPI000F95A038|nr:MULTISPECIES: hypothetical protein [unclassified Enterobacter]ROP62231.1 hypothetical protein EDF81_0714 [Enterobacter sp. BIGb0383]ROS12392.1 hypothetical protein EC848_0716 [Enterobacter sp. BIGb0359]
MEIERVREKFYVFNQSSLMLNDRSTHYYPRFNYSACELWLCTELCHLINFEEGNLHTASDGEVFIYNEDYKRDLTLYQSGTTNQPEMVKHIEVKVLYPVTRSGFEDSVENLYQKLKKSLHADSSQEGWIYLVWTQHYRVSADDFFASRIEWLKEHLAVKALFNDNNTRLNPLYSGLRDICDGSIIWRGEEKRIVVKAIAFSFIKDFREIVKEVKEEWSQTFKILADR